MEPEIITKRMVGECSSSVTDSNSIACYITASNIGVSIISLHDTPRLHTLKRVIIIFFIPRTYNDST